MARKKPHETRNEIVRTATRLFLEKGYSNVFPRMIADELDISTGNITYYFPTKEHLLAELVEMLCKFQRKMIQEVVEEGNTSLLAVCIEMTTMAAMCEDDEIAKEFYLASYSNPLTLGIIRNNDTERAKTVFAEYCSHWNDLDFAEAEILVSGIEYATLMTTDNSLPLNIRIEGALNSIMLTYNVPEEIRKDKIGKALSTDYHKLGERVLKEFKKYVEEVNEQIFREMQNH